MNIKAKCHDTVEGDKDYPAVRLRRRQLQRWLYTSPSPCNEAQLWDLKLRGTHRLLIYKITLSIPYWQAMEALS